VLRWDLRHGRRELSRFEVVHAGINAGMRIEKRLPGRHCRRKEYHAGTNRAVVVSRMCSECLDAEEVVNDVEGVRLRLRPLARRPRAAVAGESR
jgi:hypothetical protein